LSWAEIAARRGWASIRPAVETVDIHLAFRRVGAAKIPSPPSPAQSRGRAFYRSTDAANTGSASSGKSPNSCPAPRRKIFPFSADANHFISVAVPAQTQGAFRDRHGRRAGDAVDAEARSANILRGRTALTRTAKSCGPDAPTLASSRAEVFARRWWQTSPVTRESAKEAVKTAACGNAGFLRRDRGD
jgi:hypothetical protein